MCSEQIAISRFSNLSRWYTVGNNHFSTCTIWLWLILPAPSRVVQAVILWCNFKVKGLVPSRYPSHTTYRAHPRDMPHKQASLGLRDPMLEGKQPDSEWNFCAYVSEPAGGTRGQDGRSRQVQWMTVIYSRSWTSPPERNSPGQLTPTLT